MTGVNSGRSLRTMKLFHKYKLWFVSAGCFLAVLAIAFRSRESVRESYSRASTSSTSSLPPVIIWAWERPEDLGFIDNKRVGVAFLAKTIYLAGDECAVKPRMQPLTLPDNTEAIAVARIESSRKERPTLSARQMETAAAAIVSMAKLPSVRTVQIDFDAVVSERDFYRSLLARIRDDLPGSTRLSITALASWCAGDNWLAKLPVDEVVPMLFRLGVAENQFRAKANADELFLNDPCNSAVGVSTDEPRSVSNTKRLYLFNPKPWTSGSLNTALEAYHR